MTGTLFHGGCIRPGAGGPPRDWLLVDDDVVAAAGDSSDAPRADRRVDLDGATVVPAFCDAHVHLPATGLYLSGMDLRGARSSAEILAALEARSSLGGGVLFGGNFEDAPGAPLSAGTLDSVVGDRPALLARADLHSCVVSSALLRALDLGALEGVDRDERGRPTGYLRERAAATAWSWFEANLTPVQQRDAVLRAVAQAHSRGVAAVHEMHVVEWRGWPALDVTRAALEGAALTVTFYVAARDVKRVASLGFGRIGGDYFLDGSLGSQTAWMKHPYVTPPPEGTPATGISYRDDRDLVEFFTEAQGHGLQVGVHVIGDAAVEQALRAWERVAERSGIARVRELGHRLEHFECSSDEHMRRAAALGLTASVQPAFDRLWGGRAGMYASRLGPERALEMNRFRSMLAHGLTVGAGSDSTVTPLDPFLQMASLRSHHVPEQSLDGRAAFAAHTVGSHALAGRAGGVLDPGAPADLVLLDRDPLEVDVESLLATEVLATWVRGRRVWPEAED